LTAAQRDNKPGWIADLEQVIGHEFQDTTRLARALTHASARAGDGANYERLEFLGDRVLGLVIAEMLFKLYPQEDEGTLSVRLNQMVNADTCASVCDEIGLTRFVRIGSDIQSGAAKSHRGISADIMESLIAAIYLDGGIDTAARFIARHWETRARSPASARRDAKTELQEWAHAGDLGQPGYVVDSRSGPDHAPIFKVIVTVGTLAPGRGEGPSKRAAEQQAATDILVRENVWSTSGVPLDKPDPSGA
jgi:ribonuclease-3